MKIEKLKINHILGDYSIRHKVNELVDAWNSQQEEKKDDMTKKEEKNVSAQKIVDYLIDSLPRPDQPSKPSIREEINNLINQRLFKLIWADDCVDQILDLITNAIMEEVKKQSYIEHGTRVVTVTTVEGLLYNIKK